MGRSNRLVKLDIAAIGAGPCGLALGCLLARQGHRVTVYEQRRDPRISAYEDPRSINLTLSGRGMATLARLGLADTARALGVPIRARHVHLGDGSAYEQAYPAPLLSLRRSDLVRLLLDTFAALPGTKVAFRHRLESLNFTTRHAVLTDEQNGARIVTNHDFYAGADGLGSTLRQLMQPVAQIDYVQMYFGWHYKQFHLPPDAARVVASDAVHVWPGDDAMMLAFHNRDGSLSGNLFLPRHGCLGFKDIAQPTVAEGFLAARFPDLGDELHEIAGQLAGNPSGSIVRNGASKWSHRDTAVLLGDACHAVYHFYAQGVNAGLEDAAVLADQIAAQPLRLESAFTKYQELRKPSTDALAVMSEANFATLSRACGTAGYMARQIVDGWLAQLAPRLWRRPYELVVGSGRSYAAALKRIETQDLIFQLGGLWLLQLPVWLWLASGRGRHPVGWHRARTDTVLTSLDEKRMGVRPQ